MGLKKKIFSVFSVILLSLLLLASVKPAAAAIGVGTYDQCSNDQGTGYSSGDLGCRWTGGNLQTNNSKYFEHDATVQRLWLTGFDPGSTHNVTLKYGTTKGGKHAYDYLTKWDHSENWISVADRCQDITNCIGASESSFVIPDDPNVTNTVEPLGAGIRDMVIRGGTISAISTPTIASGDYSGDSETIITVTFTVNNNDGNGMCTTSGHGQNVTTTCDIALWFGAHVSSQSDWGLGNSAVNIPGSPYHVALAAVDSDASQGGGRDNQMQSATVLPSGTITIIKDADPNDPQDFPFTTTGTGLSTFSLDDDADGTLPNTQTFSQLAQGNYTVTEGSVAGWNLTNLVCTDPTTNSSVDIGNRTATINLAAGETVSCTFTNALQLGTLTVFKHVVNDNGGTATAGNFNLHVTSNGSDVSTSPDPGSESGTSYSLAAGPYAVSEDAPPAGYARTGFSGDCDANGNVTVVAGQTKTCTITNDDIQPKLTVTKIVVNNSGGTKAVSDFPLFVGATGVTSGVQNGYNAGSYVVSETPDPGYTETIGGDCDAGGNVTLAVGDVKACTITNNDKPATLTVIKHVINDNGGTAVASDFILDSGGTNDTPDNFAGSENGTDVTLDAGSYDVSETGPSGYAESDSADCAGTIALGEHKTCTVTNDDIQPTVIVIKHVVNDNGGTAVAGDFAMTVNGSSPSPASFPGAESPGTNVLLNAGAYSVTETGLTGYAESDSADCTGTIAVGQTKTCTITNDDIQPKLTVTKIVVNDNGGTKLVSDFPLFVGATGVTSGVQNGFNAGSYVASETTDPGYASAITGDCDANGNVTLALGDTKACTITNNDIAPKLHLRKVVINDNGGTATDDAFGLIANGTGVNDISGTSPVDSDGTLKADTFALSENSLVPGYAASSWVCTGGSQNASSITLGLGEESTCTITNDDIAPILHLRKLVINDNGGTATTGDFILSANGAGSNDLIGVSPVDSGPTLKADAFALGEINVLGYAASAWACTGGSQNGATVTLALGEEATCAITNDDIQPQLTLVKTVVNDNGGTLGVSDFPLFVNATSVVSGATNGFDAGTYTASETSQTGYAPSGWGGDCAADGSVTLSIGENKTCTITNDDIQPKLTLVKIVVNDNGGNKQTSDFPLFVGATGVVSGIANGFDAGPYLASETPQTGYLPSGWSGDCDANGNVTLAVGDNKTCTITNNDIAPKLTLVKTVTNDNGGTKTVSDFPLFISSVPATSGTAYEEAANTLLTASETQLAGYAASAWGGDCAADGTITLLPGDNKTCTVTNDDMAPVLHLRKVVINDNGGTATVADFPLSANGTGANDISGTSPVDSGAGLLADTFALGETSLGGYAASAWACSGGTQNGTNITVGLGEEATCTVTNDDIAPTLTVTKILVPNTDTGKFNLQIDGTTAGNATDVGDGGTTGAVAVNAGTHTAGEAAGTGTALTDYQSVIGGDCAADGSVTLALAENKTCTITNTRLGSLKIVKDAQPDDEQDFTYNTVNLAPAGFILDDDGGQDPTYTNSQLFDHLAAGTYGVSEVVPNAFWKLDSISCVSAGTTDPYTDLTTSATGVSVHLTPGAQVECTFLNIKTSPTRTLGFWQTHTTFTENIFDTNMSGSFTVGTGSHVRTIDSYNKLFGAFYANIAKTSTGAKRTALDQARMQLLQQLVAAKLNCAAFGCASSVQTLIANADAAYAGTNRSLILSYASQLDAFNMSGDTLAIPSIGSATPGVSKNLATTNSGISFWDNP